MDVILKDLSEDMIQSSKSTDLERIETKIKEKTTKDTRS